MTHHGSKAKRLDTIKTPYVEASETIIFANIGSWMFCTALIAQSMAQTSMLNGSACAVKIRLAR